MERPERQDPVGIPQILQRNVAYHGLTMRNVRGTNHRRHEVAEARNTRGSDPQRLSPLRASVSTRLRLFAPLMFLLAATAFAGSDMSSSSYKLRRSAVNPGGPGQPTSASYKLTNPAGTPGGSLF